MEQEKKNQWAEKSGFCAEHKICWGRFVPVSVLLVVDAFLLGCAPAYNLILAIAFVILLLSLLLEVFLYLRVEHSRIRILRSMYEDYFDYCVSMKRINFEMRRTITELETKQKEEEKP